jgi:phosphatidylglycerophosphatase A
MKEKLISAIRISLSTFLYVGKIPFAPGTMGSLATIIILWFSKDFVALYLTPEKIGPFLLFIIVFTAVGVWLSNDTQKNFGKGDPGSVVIDEVVGQLITFTLLPIALGWESLLLGFVLFRFFDIIKPWPVYKFEELDDGLGIMMDDVIAGIMAALSIQILTASYNAIVAFL